MWKTNPWLSVSTCTWKDSFDFFFFFFLLNGLPQHDVQITDKNNENPAKEDTYLLCLWLESSSVKRPAEAEYEATNNNCFQNLMAISSSNCLNYFFYLTNSPKPKHLKFVISYSCEKHPIISLRNYPIHSILFIEYNDFNSRRSWACNVKLLHPNLTMCLI